MTNLYHLEKLEFNLILERLASFTRSEAGKNLALSVLPIPDYSNVIKLQSETMEAIHAKRQKVQLLGTGFEDVRALAAQAERGAVLTAVDLLSIMKVAKYGNSRRNSLSEFSDIYPNIWAHIRQIAGLETIIQSIDAVVEDTGIVRDNASSELEDIRYELRETRDSIIQKMESMIRSPHLRSALQEQIVVLRDGRYVLPVKAGHQGAIPGIVHDTSSSGATIFMQPQSTIRLGNTLRELQSMEQREVSRLLRELSQIIGRDRAQIDQLIQKLAYLDLTQAKSELGATLQAEELYLEATPEDWISDKQSSFELVRARHPLIGDSVVPLSLHLGAMTNSTVPTPRAILITGPNTGGKTVSLKTAGLLSLMALSGLPVPAAKGSQFPIFDNILVDIGDEQSIQQSLSTFSSHISKINEILLQATPGSLVLLDEIGAGTDPTEGAALGIAIIDHLLEQHVSLICTTHHGELKLYAHENPNLTNAATEFDTKTLQPTYRLVVGLPGESNAITIAEKLGVPRHITEKAREELGDQNRNLNKILEDLKDNLEHAEQSTAAARQEQEIATNLREITEQEISDLAARAEKEITDELRYLRQESVRIKRSLDRSKGEIEDARLQEFETELTQAADDIDSLYSRQETLIENWSQSSDNNRVSIDDLTPGLLIRVNGFELPGEIKNISQLEQRVTVVFGSIPAEVGIDSVLSISTHPYEKQTIRIPKPDSIPASELDLHGFTVEQATPVLEQYLDQAIRANMHRVRIVHGKGSGTLRRAVRQFLEQHPITLQFSSAPAEAGGDGVTVIEIT